ncbi:alpha/beta hydrolase [Solwaraspora sp. WMMA2080]|uniref:alpha/beta fold hydrolase n=1 Tax=unclassified Solwaraspora TaxID=2627926 RepID=UPI00248C91F3|nr:MULTISPECIES: alpha/beta hydrolase [unclassified Solwaraspora]WBB97853.1 alpha/beta hydrolase [Solwaraspora sp. WMMA2059]WBC18258.1 alpha/beta hydrolase [Solwaraspora sp. WMMA2080]
MTSIYRSEDARRAVEQRYRALLRRWPVPATESTVPTRHGDTFAIVCGPRDAPPVFLLHGGSFNSAAWTGDVAVWAQTHRVYAVDVIGEPGFSAPSRPSLTSGCYADWLDDVLAAFDIGRAAFVGASLGGWLALDYAQRRPERITRLALLVPGGIGRQKDGAVIGSLFLLPFGAWGRRAAVRLVLGPPPAASDVTGMPESAELAAFLLLIQRSYRRRRDRLPVFSDDRLRRLTVPLLVVAGAKDRLLDSRQTARRVRRLLPQATVVLLPDTGHIPVGYTGSVQRFLAGEDARVPGGGHRSSRVR